MTSKANGHAMTAPATPAAAENGTLMNGSAVKSCNGTPSRNIPSHAHLLAEADIDHHRRRYLCCCSLCHVKIGSYFVLIYHILCLAVTLFVFSKVLITLGHGIIKVGILAATCTVLVLQICTILSVLASNCTRRHRYLIFYLVKQIISMVLMVMFLVATVVFIIVQRVREYHQRANVQVYRQYHDTDGDMSLEITIGVTLLTIFVLILDLVCLRAMMAYYQYLQYKSELANGLRKASQHPSKAGKDDCGKCVYAF